MENGTCTYKNVTCCYETCHFYPLKMRPITMKYDNCNHQKLWNCIHNHEKMHHEMCNFENLHHESCLWQNYTIHSSREKWCYYVIKILLFLKCHITHITNLKTFCYHENMYDHKICMLHQTILHHEQWKKMF